MLTSNALSNQFLEREWFELARRANWSVSKLAKFCNVSVRTLERHFVEETGMTPKRWLVEQRHAEAANQMRAGATVKETAWKAGYRHASTFTREFHKYLKRCAVVPRPTATVIPKRRAGVA